VLSTYQCRRYITCGLWKARISIESRVFWKLHSPIVFISQKRKSQFSVFTKSISIIGSTFSKQELIASFMGAINFINSLVKAVKTLNFQKLTYEYVWFVLSCLHVAVTVLVVKVRNTHTHTHTPMSRVLTIFLHDSQTIFNSVEYNVLYLKNNKTTD